MKKTLKAAVKVILCLMCSILIILSFCGCEEEEIYPNHTEEFFVNDFSDVLTQEEEDEIFSMGVALQQKTTAQVVVATVETTNNIEIEEYALQLARKWGIGTEEDDNGVLLLLATEDRQVYIAVGYGLEGALPDSKTGRILDIYGVPYFESNNFSVGLKSVYSTLVNEVYVEYGITPEDYTPISQIPEYYGEEANAKEIAISWIILVIVIVLYVFVFKGRGLFLFFGGPTNFRGGGGFSGGFSGGSGGFGGFSGGGGGFGGGGAGRGF